MLCVYILWCYVLHYMNVVLSVSVSMCVNSERGDWTGLNAGGDCDCDIGDSRVLDIC